MRLLQGEGLSKTFTTPQALWGRAPQAVRALQDISFHVDASETLALVGGSGSGKSTLARIVAGLATADTGSLLWEGKPLELFTARERAHRIQMIFQDPYASLNPKLTIGTQLAEAVRPSPQPSPRSRRGEGEPDGREAGLARVRGTVTERCIQWLSKVGMPVSAMNAYPFQFSGGQRQRIAIARALAVEPRLLIADEPLSALDVTIQAQILSLFKTLKSELQLTMLFITHDLAIVSEVADRMFVLQDGVIVEQGDPKTVLRAPTHPYTQKLLAAVPQLA